MRSGARGVHCSGWWGGGFRMDVNAMLGVGSNVNHEYKVMYKMVFTILRKFKKCGGRGRGNI